MQSNETPGAIANYSEIAEALRKEIRAGAYSKEGSFPSLTKIMRRFGVSRPSAVRSIAELKRLGLVTARKGAGTFVSQKNRTIGLAIPGTADSEFFSAIMDGLVFNCNKYGMDLVAGDIFAVDHDKRAKQAERLARHFASVGVAGVIMQPVGFSENAHELNGIISDILDKAGIPVVLVDYDIVPPPSRSKYDLVAIDNFGAGRKVAAHLLKAGAKKICCLLRPLCAESVHTRFAGVEAEVFRTTGCHATVVVGEPTDGKVVAEALKKFRPDAIVCSNDIAAGWLLKTLKKLGVAVPGDIMVAGFDDVRAAAGMKPPLTSVRQPCFDISNMAFKALLERMANAKLPPREILLDTTLVVRKSTTPTH
ncbi:MAG: substrate-binding domain-containing protein [Kiritimatiellae bacterium]|nr:substrate-binding domain-containing protein [Kiritimatiellia bacterium]